MCCLLNKIFIEKHSDHQLPLEVDEPTFVLVIKMVLYLPYNLILYTFYTLFFLSILIIIFDVIAYSNKKIALGTNGRFFTC